MPGQPVARGGHLLHVVDVAGLCGFLRVAVFHDEDASSAGGRAEGLGGRGRQLGQDRGVSAAEVAAAAPGARQLRATVMVVHAFGRGPPQRVEVLQVLGHVGKVRRDARPSQSAQLIVRRLRHLLENCLVKVRLPLDIFFTRLFDLHNDRNDYKDDHHAGGHADDSPAGVGQLVQETGFPLFCRSRRVKTTRKTRHNPPGVNMGQAQTQNFKTKQAERRILTGLEQHKRIFLNQRPRSLFTRTLCSSLSHGPPCFKCEEMFAESLMRPPDWHLGMISEFESSRFPLVSPPCLLGHGLRCPELIYPRRGELEPKPEPSPEPKR